MNFLPAFLLLLQAVSPAVVAKTDVPYPALAKAQRVEGTVRVSLTAAPRRSREASLPEC